MVFAFDFDGTICDGTATVVDILNLKFKEIGYTPVTFEELRASGLKGIFASRKVDMDKLKGTLTSGKKLFGEKIPSLKTFPNLIPVLERLSQKHTLGIITSNAKGNVDLFLKNNHIETLFSFVSGDSEIFGKEGAIGEHKPDYYVGDETRDIDAAKKVGCKSVSVTWGFESRELLEKSSPDYCISTPEELLTLPVL